MPTPKNLRPLSFPKVLRLRHDREFSRVYASKVYIADGVLVINACRSADPQTRLGLSVSKKVGNAVTRNRWKRLIREAFRLSQSHLPTGWDLVVRPKRGAIPQFQAITQSLRSLAERLDRRRPMAQPANGVTPKGNR